MNKDMKLVMTLGQLTNILCESAAAGCVGCPIEEKYPDRCPELSDEEVLEVLSEYGITSCVASTPLSTQIFVSDENISHILPTLNAEINRLKEENKHLRKKTDKAEKDLEALKKHTNVLENKVDDYERRICGTTAIVPKPSPGYRIVFERINVSSVHKNSDGTYNICLWGDSVESLREKMACLEENNKAYGELCMSLQQITDRKEIPNERAYTEHDSD